MAGWAQEIHRAIAEAKAQPQPGSDEAAQIADKLLSEAAGYRSGAHCDNPGSKWQRKHSRPAEHSADAALAAVDNYIEVVDIVLEEAGGLSERSRRIWELCDIEGLSQARVARMEGVSERHIRRILTAAREELKYMVDSNAKRVFRSESHRTAYFAPGHRPVLPDGVEEAREQMEQPAEITTHIMPDALTTVEVWLDGKRQVEYEPDGTEEGREVPLGAKRVSSLAKRGAVIRRRRLAKIKMRKFRERMSG